MPDPITPAPMTATFIIISKLGKRCWNLTSSEPALGILFFLSVPNLELQHGFAIFIGHDFADVLVHADHLSFLYQHHRQVGVYGEEIAMVYQNGLTLSGYIEDGAHGALKDGAGEGSFGRGDVYAVVHGGDAFKVGVFVHAEGL